MAGQGWQGAFLRKRWRISSTKQDPRHTPAPDLVQRQFTAPAPDRLWVADAERHEALWNRVEVGGLHLLAVAAAG